MQSDRRHDLETNDLADSAAAIAQRIRPHFGTIGIAAAALLLAFAAWTVVDSRRAAAREESWDAFLAALSGGQVPALDAVSIRYPGTPAAQWARLVLADGMLGQGSQLLASDRTRAEQLLQDAAARYAALLTASPLDLVAERATFGLAKARENLGNLDEARRGYESLVAEHPDSAVRPFAEARIAALGKESTRRWYDWFAQQKPAPQDAADGAAASSSTPPAAGSTGPGTAAEPRATEPADAGAAVDAPG